MKVHGIKHALDGGVKVRLESRELSKEIPTGEELRQSLFGSFPGGLLMLGGRGGADWEVPVEIA